MPVRIENQTCYFKVDENGEEKSLAATDVTVITDSEKSMSAVELAGRRIYITEAQADALTVAGAKDGRKHLKATDGDSVI
jgi:exosome complex RNA-binding protein Rrp42 (RNase PH superfamily)